MTRGTSIARAILGKSNGCPKTNPTYERKRARGPKRGKLASDQLSAACRKGEHYRCTSIRCQCKWCHVKAR